jgi:hypothetical protein
MRKISGMQRVFDISCRKGDLFIIGAPAIRHLMFIEPKEKMCGINPKKTVTIHISLAEKYWGAQCPFLHHEMNDFDKRSPDGRILL